MIILYQGKYYKLSRFRLADYLEQVRDGRSPDPTDYFFAGEEVVAIDPATLDPFVLQQIINEARSPK